MAEHDRAPVQVWTLADGGHDHEVAVWGSFRRRFEWRVDGELVSSKRTSDDRTDLKAEGHGMVTVRFTSLGSPRRATYFDASTSSSPKATVGLGGVDFTPAPGSKAAKFEQRLVDHPRLYPILEAFESAGGIVAGLLFAAAFAWLMAHIPWPNIDLPDIPWPNIDLPDIPWPRIPWPDIDLPDINLPGWVGEVLDVLKLVFPIVLAFVVARAEVRRRHRRDRPADDEQD